MERLHALNDAFACQLETLHGGSSVVIMRNTPLLGVIKDPVKPHIVADPVAAESLKRRGLKKRKHADISKQGAKSAPKRASGDSKSKSKTSTAAEAGSDSALNVSGTKAGKAEETKRKKCATPI